MTDHILLAVFLFVLGGMFTILASSSNYTSTEDPSGLTKLIMTLIGIIFMFFSSILFHVAGSGHPRSENALRTNQTYTVIPSPHIVQLEDQSQRTGLFSLSQTPPPKFVVYKKDGHIMFAPITKDPSDKTVTKDAPDK